MFRYWIGVVSLMLSCIFKSHAATLAVPTDYPTIQAAVDAARDGDTVIVKPGVYRENVVVTRSVSLIAEAGQSGLESDILKTVIDGGANGLIGITYESPTWQPGDKNCLLSGFTVRNCSPRAVKIFRALPNRIENMIAEDNLNDGFYFNHWWRDEDSVGKNRGQRIYNIVARRNLGAGFVGDCNGGIQFDSCKIYNNRDGLYFGCDGNGGHWLVNSLVYGNLQMGIRGDVSWKIINTTVAGNGTIGEFGGVVLIHNSILYGPNGLTIGDGALIEVDYSLVQGGQAVFQPKYSRQLKYGANNFGGDPKFISPSTGDYRLRDDSPAIGSGGSLPVVVDNLRVAQPTGSGIDVGADENSRAYPLVSEFAVFGAITQNLCAKGSNGAIQLFIANGADSLDFLWKGPGGFSSASKNIGSSLLSVG